MAMITKLLYNSVFTRTAAQPRILALHPDTFANCLSKTSSIAVMTFAI